MIRFAKKQSGQALIYGLYMTVVLGAALFFLFNIGQSVSEKTRMTNAADMVAYSAATLEARLLNYIAYTNRALIANEVTAAQLVSLGSWADFTAQYVVGTFGLGCDLTNGQSEPELKQMTALIPSCLALAAAGANAINEAQQLQVDAKAAFAEVETAKALLLDAQNEAITNFQASRTALLQEIAASNVGPQLTVDPVFLENAFDNFAGSSVIALQTGADRARLAEPIQRTLTEDGFVQNRSWQSEAEVPACFDTATNDYRYDVVDRTGGTALIGLDQWRARDAATISRSNGTAPTNPIPLCGGVTTSSLASATLATNDGSPNAWAYSGIPNYFDLSPAALAYTATNLLPAQKQLRLRLSVRVRSAGADLSTSDGTSLMKPSGRLNLFNPQRANAEMSAVGSAEVFFYRGARDDGAQELPSLFNPYWRVRLADTSPAALTEALTRQGVNP